MTQDEIIWQNEVLEMARQAEKYADLQVSDTDMDIWERIVYLQFAKLVEERTAAKEREACAKVCGEYNFGQAPKMIQDAIRARAQADRGEA